MPHHLLVPVGVPVFACSMGGAGRGNLVNEVQCTATSIIVQCVIRKLWTALTTQQHVCLVTLSQIDQE